MVVSGSARISPYYRMPRILYNAAQQGAADDAAPAEIRPITTQEGAKAAMKEATAYYRIDGLPMPTWKQFEAAVEEVSSAAKARGEAAVSQTEALVALLGAVDLPAAVAAGQAVAAATYNPRAKTDDRGFHLPTAVKARLSHVAKARGIKVGAVGRLVLQAHAQDLPTTISRGLTARRPTSAGSSNEQPNTAQA